MKKWEGENVKLERKAEFSKLMSLLREGKPVVALLRVGSIPPSVTLSGTWPAMHWVAVTGFDEPNRLIYYTDTNSKNYQMSYDNFMGQWNWSVGDGFANEALWKNGVQTKTITWVDRVAVANNPTPNPQPVADLSFDARFRAINDWASARGYVSAFPNFHQADYGSGVVFGVVLLNSGTAEVRDISMAELGNPQTNEERFRAVNDWASRHGYAAAFPNFHQADYGSGVVFGVVLLNSGTAVLRDISVAELGNPQTNEARFRAVNDWASRHGYAAAFPNFHQADYGSGVVFGVVLLNSGTGVVRDVPVSELR